jgi:hypothetical protein
VEGIWLALIRGSIAALTILTTKSCLYSRLSKRDLKSVPFYDLSRDVAHSRVVVVWGSNVGVFVKISRAFFWSVLYNVKMRLIDLVEKRSRRSDNSPGRRGRLVVSLTLRSLYSQYALISGWIRTVRYVTRGVSKCVCVCVRARFACKLSECLQQHIARNRIVGD